MEPLQLLHQLTADLSQVAQSLQTMHGPQAFTQITAHVLDLQRVTFAQQCRYVAAKLRVSTTPGLQHQHAQTWMHAEIAEKSSHCAQLPRWQQGLEQDQLLASVQQCRGGRGLQPWQLVTKASPPGGKLEHDWLGISPLKLRWTEGGTSLLVGR